ncbi:MAG: HEAT repeat domain-containing protein [Methanomicrobiales archaeon]
MTPANLLRHPEKDERARGVEECVMVGPAVIPALIPLLADPAWVVRYRAAEAIGRIGGMSAAPLLVPLLTDEKDHVRYMAAKGLCRCGDPSLVPRLEPLTRDENEYVRAMAGRAIRALAGQNPR